MDETKTSNPSPEKPTDKDYKKKRVEEIGSTLTQIRARVKANRSCARKDDDSKSSSPREILSEKSEKYIQVLQLDKAKAQKLEKERPKIKEAIENLIIDREHHKLVEKKIEETRAKQSAPLPEIPAEVQKRISDLELTIHNLKETLSEKERVLESKTESWRLLSDQLEQRNVEVVDKFEVMAKEIDEVKRRYGEQEVFLRQELDRCKQKILDSDSLLISQENERQETDDLKSKLENLQNCHFQCESKIESEKKLSLKLKAQLKKMKNELGSSKGLSDEVEKLRNVIAGLEEEKGNHLLQLIDFDEYKESSLKYEARTNELEDCVRILERDLDLANQQHLQLDQDKKTLVNSLSEKEEAVANLRLALEKMEQSKISAEFKAAELEEKLEVEGSEKMTKEVDNLVQHVREQDALVEELRRAISSRDEEMGALKEGRVDELRDLLAEWRDKYTRVEDSVSKLQEEKYILTTRLGELQAELEGVTAKNETLVSELKAKETAIDQHLKTNQELMESLAKYEDKLVQLEPKQGDDHTQKLKKLAANLKIKVKLCKELENKVSELSDKITLHEDSIAKLTSDKSELESLVSEYKNKLETVALDSNVVDELQRLLREKEVMISKLSEQQQVVEQQALQRARTESHGEIQHLREENLLLESKLNENLIEIHCVGDDRAPENLVEVLKNQLEDKSCALGELEATAADLRAQLESMNGVEGQNKTLLNEQAKLIDELKSEISLLRSSEQAIELNISEKNGLEQRIRGLEEELQESKSAINSKETIISNFEKELNLFRHEISESENQLIKMGEFYSEEASKRDGVLSNLEIELGLSKAETIKLCEELGEVSRNFDQCMENLRAKDQYIDRLETDLSGMRTRVEILEASIEEKQRNMEERALQLGQKLDQAACKNNDFEMCRAEMENRLKLYEKTEEQLGSRVEQMQQELEEIRAGKELVEEDRRAYMDRVEKLELELSDIKGAYNTTLDQIELLNGELKQVMDQIEHRNKELVRIGEERNRLIDRLSELEESCTDLQTQLRGYEEQSAGLRTELDCKLKELDTATAEITSLQSQLGTGSLTTDLNRELQELRNQYEERLRELQVEKNDLLNVLRGSVEPELDSVVQAAEHRAVEKQELSDNDKQEEIKLFSWEGHTEAQTVNKSEGFHIDDVALGQAITHVECDDDWGWSPAEARLEEEHQNSDASKIRTLESELNKVTQDKEKFEEEVKSLKIKCSKLLGKIKEIKSQGERKTSKTGFEDLHFAMQEELRSQVDELDKKNKELAAEVAGMKSEKERLTKRIETLTSANNQLIDMKERQDIEVQVWQRNCTELKNQLQSCDWNWSPSESKPASETTPTKEISDKRTSELEDKLSFLETENEELLQIICSLRDEKQANNNLLTELNNLKEENSSLKLTAQGSVENSKEISRLTQMIEAETQEKLSLEKQTAEEKNKLEAKLQDLSKQLELVQEQYRILEVQVNSTRQSGQQVSTLEAELEERAQQISTLTENVDCLRETIRELSGENEALQASNTEADKINQELKEQLSKLDDAVKQVHSLLDEQVKLSSEIERLTATVETLTAENTDLKVSYESKLSELDLLRADMKLVEASKDSALADLHTVREQLNRNVESQGQGSTASPNVTMFQDIPSVPVHSEEDVSSSAETSSLFSFSSIFGVSTPIQAKPSSMPVELIPESPPVFRGFSSDQTDAFSSVIQKQFEPREEPPVIQASTASELHSSPQTNPQLEQVQNLKEKITQLEFENSNLLQKLNESHQEFSHSSLSSNILTEKDNEIGALQNQIHLLNEEVRSVSARCEAERSELVRLNQDLERKIHEYDRVIESERNEVNRLRSQVDKLRRNEVNLTETSDDLNALRQQMDERLRQAELNFQNILLNKDEENAHLVCELSASRATCDKLTLQVNTLKGQVESLENELRQSKGQNEALTRDMGTLNQNLDKLNFDCLELRKANENQIQFYSAQVDYLQLSIQEKDATIERFNSEVNELNIQLASLHEQTKAASERASYLESCYSTVSTAHSEMSSECAALQEKLVAASSETERLSGTVASLTHELSEHRSSTESHQAQHSDSILQIEQLQSAIHEKDLEIERLSKLLTGVQEKLIKAEESKVTDQILNLTARLDKALYTLHLRDVRCDELTVEIMQLLEERDALQLRLSEVLRDNESMRVSSSEPNSLTPPPPIKQSSSSQDLSNKMGELHTGYMKDPAVQMDLQNRYSQQMHLFTSTQPEMGTVGGEGERKLAEAEPASSDYGILSWFFSSSTPPQPSQDPAAT